MFNIQSLQNHYRLILDVFAHEDQLLGDSGAYVTLSKLIYKLDNK